MAYMPAGELRVVREWLGLSTVDLSRLLEVRQDTVRRWETGRERIPHRVRGEIESTIYAGQCRNCTYRTPWSNDNGKNLTDLLRKSIHHAEQKHGK